MERTLALVSLYSLPDANLLESSCQTVWSCQYQGPGAYTVVDVKLIISVVAMIPRGESFFMVEKIGLDVAEMGGVEEEMLED